MFLSYTCNHLSRFQRDTKWPQECVLGAQWHIQGSRPSGCFSAYVWEACVFLMQCRWGFPHISSFLWSFYISRFIIWSFLCTKGLYCLAQVSGSKFYYLKNEAVLLEMALVNWAISEVSKKGFTPLITPEIVRSSVVEKCGFQPRAQNTQVWTPLLKMVFKV